MAPDNAARLRPIYAEWGRGNWRPYFEIYVFALRERAMEAVS